MSQVPVCPKCCVWMRCKKNGHAVGTATGRRWDSDLFECPECGSQVALLASMHWSMHWPEPAPLNAVRSDPDTMLRDDQ